MYPQHHAELFESKEGTEKLLMFPIYPETWLSQGCVRNSLCSGMDNTVTQTIIYSSKIETLHCLKVRDVRNSCSNNEVSGSFSDCNKALKMAAEEIGYCAMDSVDGMQAPWDKPHDDMNAVVEDDVVEARWTGLCSLNF